MTPIGANPPASAQAMPAGADANRNEYLTFRLGAEEYGIDLLTVREIRGGDPVTPTISAPVFVKGVIDLRGISVPIVDLRTVFNCGQFVPGETDAVIIVGLSDRLAGIVVDSVRDVLTLAADQVRATLEPVAKNDIQCVMGTGERDQRRLTLIDIERLMGHPDIGLDYRETC